MPISASLLCETRATDWRRTYDPQAANKDDIRVYAFFAVCSARNFSVAGAINYRKIVKDANNVLAILVENDGKFPMTQPPGDGLFFDDKRHKDDRRFSTELPYESRYFSVFFAADGRVVSINTGKIATVDTANSVDFERSAIRSGKTRGFSNVYRCAVYAVGEAHIVFLDCGREMSSFRTFLFTCGGVSLAGLAAMLILLIFLIFLSARIVKPFSENYEK